MATSYTTRYRRGMGANYGSTLAEALESARQYEAMSGRYLTPEERAAIARGALAPYVSDYSTGMYRAGQLEQEAKRTDLMEEAQRANEEAAKMQGYLNMGSLGLNAALTAAITKQAGMWGGPSTTPAGVPGAAAPAAATTLGAPTAAAEIAPEVGGPLAQAWGTPTAAAGPQATSMAGPYALAALAALSAGTQVPGVRELYPKTIGGVPFRHPLMQASKYGLGGPLAVATLGLSTRQGRDIYKKVAKSIGSTVKKIGKKLGF